MVGKCLKQHCRMAHNDIELVFAVDPCIARHLYCSRRMHTHFILRYVAARRGTVPYI